MDKPKEKPKVFISYSWSSQEHEKWVLNLAAELVDNVIDVILDKWELKEGHDAHAFMEKMVTDSEIKKVIIVCDKVYAEKSNKRKGGAGTEAQIISSELYQKVEQDKFVAVIAEKDDNGKPYLPVYYSSRIYIDLSDTESYSENLDKLLRWIYGKPIHIKPEYGKEPAFLSEETSINLGTSSRLRRAIDANKNGKSISKALTIEYFDIFSENLERFRITEKVGEYDDQVVKSIEDFIPYRNESIEMFKIISLYNNNNDDVSEILHSFFEKLTVYLDKPEYISGFNNSDFDNFTFIVHELYLYCIACLINYKRFEVVSFLLSTKYFIKYHRNYGNNVLVSFQIFRSYLETLERRNKRLKLGRISLHADLIRNRNLGTGINFELIMQADFILFMRDCYDCLRTNEYNYKWYPYTLLFKNSSNAFEIFARAESKIYFDKIKTILDINDPSDLGLVWNAFKTGKYSLPNMDIHFVYPQVYINFDKLATTK